MLCLAIPASGLNKIDDLKNIKLTNNQVKSLRDDIRRSIYVIKSKKNSELLPELKFYRYRAQKNDSFWTILTNVSQNIDTLMTVNSLSSPGEVETGKTIYIPNMRGILYKIQQDETVRDIARRFQIEEAYILKINNRMDPSNPYIFIPCASISNLERSLFLGTGFSNPIKTGRLTSGFGIRKDPFSDTSQFHRGIDIACHRGTKIHAARGGKIVYSGYSGGYGLLVVIQHSHDYYSYYGHLSKVLKSAGDTVDTGEAIALSGNTGRTTGPHLHFEARKGLRAVNPGLLLK